VSVFVSGAYQPAQYRELCLNLRTPQPTSPGLLMLLILCIGTLSQVEAADTWSLTG
jgi:hypothetical protein